jgi:hypothetical protein
MKTRHPFAQMVNLDKGRKLREPFGNRQGGFKKRENRSADIVVRADVI